ncbi:unnamed protein product [Closterium sp. Yama58-4]|nr:unnamed protein product [Closterium sp. Yama58-4]
MATPCRQRNNGWTVLSLPPSAAKLVNQSAEKRRAPNWHLAAALALRLHDAAIRSKCGHPTGPATHLYYRPFQSDMGKLY